MKKLRIHPSILLLGALPLLGLLNWIEVAILWGCAALHEAGHIAAYGICGTELERIDVLPFGLCADPGPSLNLTPMDEVFCAAAGPAMNLLGATLLLALPFPAQSDTARYALYCNLSLLLINLLPVLPLDGGRMLYYLFAQKWDASRCEGVCRTVAILVLGLLLIPAGMALVTEKNPSLAMIWGYLTGYTVLRKGVI